MGRHMKPINILHLADRRSQLDPGGPLAEAIRKLAELTIVEDAGELSDEAELDFEHRLARINQETPRARSDRGRFFNTEGAEDTESGKRSD
jgi:hypothetical protein